MAFIKNKENFVCENCGFEVIGDGYTNHCPKCLWSKHVDLDPGDRKSECGGLMEPIRIESKSGEFRVLHRCQRCLFERWNKVSKADEYDKLIG